MIDIPKHIPADYFISIRGRKPDPDKEGKTKEAIYYVGWRNVMSEDIVFTQTFGKSANFKTAEDAYRLIFDPQFREAFQATIENDKNVERSERLMLDKTSIDVLIYGASHVANVSDINPMDLI
ncbi:MAG: hypothetical protein JXR12_05880 [Neptunomonas phycophila]|uniref:hypothetical protein n=1 Tax=Neptunomonas phycophila TaxID=1572645 RepID=UPI003B8C8423